MPSFRSRRVFTPILPMCFQQGYALIKSEVISRRKSFLYIIPYCLLRRLLLWQGLTCYQTNNVKLYLQNLCPTFQLPLLSLTFSFSIIVILFLYFSSNHFAAYNTIFRCSCDFQGYCDKVFCTHHRINLTATRHEFYSRHK